MITEQFQQYSQALLEEIEDLERQIDKLEREEDRERDDLDKLIRNDTSQDNAFSTTTRIIPENWTLATIIETSERPGDNLFLVQVKNDPDNQINGVWIPGGLIGDEVLICLVNLYDVNQNLLRRWVGILLDSQATQLKRGTIITINAGRTLDVDIPGFGILSVRVLVYGVASRWPDEVVPKISVGDEITVVNVHEEWYCTYAFHSTTLDCS